MNVRRNNSNRWIEQLKQSKKESEKDWRITLILSIFLGVFGIDRFYLGKILTGIIKFLTLGGLGIWWIIDIFLIITERMKDFDGRIVRKP